MITVRVCGGLGNQMFQFAAGRALSARTGAPMRLDIAAFKYESRTYDLASFGIRNELFDSDDLLPPLFRHGRLLDRLLFKANRVLPPEVRRYHAEARGYVFDPLFARLGGSVTLSGYWQSEKYFESIADSIRTTFDARPAYGAEDERIIAYIQSEATASLHVRRGDYVANSLFNRVHGTVSLDYYQDAVEYLRSRAGIRRFAVFSDDPEWCRENLPFLEQAIFVSHNSGKRAFCDLGLMSACRHHIIANSSFSWWGAWLNPNREKIVITPKKWLTEATTEGWDLIPDKWIRL